MRVIIIISKKNCSGQMDHFGPKNGNPHNSGSTVRIFLNSAQWQGTIGRWKTIKIYRVQKKKYFDNSVGAKTFTNNYSLLFKKLVISGKQKKSPTENNNIAPGTSSESS